MHKYIYILLTYTRDNIMYSPDYHIHFKHKIISIESNSTRIANPNILIFYNKIKTESNLERISDIFFFRHHQETFTFLHECNTYLTNTIKNNEASIAWCGFIWFILKDTEVQNSY